MSRQVLRCWAAASTAAWDPRRGWAEADRTRRGMAVAVVPTLAAWLVVAVVAAHELVGVLLLLLLAVFLVPMTYEAARVLRPYRSTRHAREARIRHGLAAVGTGLGLPVLLALALLVERVGLAATPAFAFALLWLGVIPLAAGVLTLAWGLLVALGRVATSPDVPSPCPPLLRHRGAAR